jgi:hypothetical protein
MHFTAEDFHLDALLFISVYSGIKCWPSVLDVTIIRVLPRYFRNSSLFTFIFKNSPPARCVSAANQLCKDAIIFSKPISSFLEQILRKSVTFLYQFI